MRLRNSDGALAPASDPVSIQLRSRRRKIPGRGVATERGSPQAVLRAMNASPHPSAEDVEELVRAIGKRHQSSSFDNPLARWASRE